MQLIAAVSVFFAFAQVLCSHYLRSWFIVDLMIVGIDVVAWPDLLKFWPSDLSKSKPIPAAQAVILLEAYLESSVGGAFRSIRFLRSLRALRAMAKGAGVTWGFVWRVKGLLL